MNEKLYRSQVNPRINYEEEEEKEKTNVINECFGLVLIIKWWAQ